MSSCPAESCETWLVLSSGQRAADWNMALDEALLEHAASLAAPLLRFYGWNEPAATFGYSQRYADVECATLLRPLVRRPTGGGLVPHDADWTYSAVFPPGHAWYSLKAVESYERMHQWIADAFAALQIVTTLSPRSVKDIPGQCFIGAEKFDVLWQGKKIAGAAQRRTKSGLLIQGSVQPPPIRLDRSDWEKSMCQVAGEKWGVHWRDFEISDELQSCAITLARERYSRPAFNQKR
jgi:lipoyl(octanoyl) transferase